MPSNAEILAQLERLAEARRPQCVPALNAADEDGDTYCRNCGVGIYVGEQRWCQSQLNPIAPILAAVKRWVKIEEAARECRKMDEESCRWSREGLTEAQWDEWWEAHCKAHGEAYDALDAHLKEPS